MSRGALALFLARRRLRLAMSDSTSEEKKACARRPPSLPRRGIHSGKSRISKGSRRPSASDGYSPTRVQRRR